MGCNMKRKYLIIYSVIAIIILGFIGYNIKESSLGYAFDEPLISSISTFRTESLTLFMKGVTFLGSGEFLIFLGILLSVYIYKKLDKSYIFLVLNSLLISFGANALLKNYFGRIRPIKYMIIEQGGYSFPSGHSMVSMSFYITLTYIICRNTKNLLLKKMIGLVNGLLIFLIGFSRIYLGVHWPTDVIVGFLMGLGVAAWGIYILEDRGNI